MQYTTEALVEILSNHALWLTDSNQGERADLSGADLTRAYLAVADLTRAYLANADLTRANLYDTDLSDANLTCADLSGAKLTGANLSYADLSYADLIGADLRSADLTGADLTRATGVVDLGCPDGWRAVGWWKDGEPWVRVGCRTMSLDEGRAYWADKPERREVVAALDYFEAVAKIRAGTDKAEAA